MNSNACSFLVFCCFFLAVNTTAISQTYGENLPTQSEVEEVVVTNFSDIESTIGRRIQAVEFIEGTIERQLSWFNISITVIGALLLAFGAVASVVFSRWLSNTQTAIRENIGLYVAQELSVNEDAQSGFEQLAKSLKAAKEEHDEIKLALSELVDFERRMSTNRDDPSFSFSETKRIEAQSKGGSLSREDRRIVLGHLHNVIDQGVSGIVDPNTLFNSSVVANRLDFDEESIRLATLANHYKPCASHAMLLADLQNTYGVGFELAPDGFSRIDLRPGEVRKQAREKALLELRKAPREQCELIYSRASNIAVKEREFGLLGGMIAAIDASIEAPDRSDGVGEGEAKELTSYAYMTLADFHAMKGDVGWEMHFRNNLELSVRVLVTEPRMASWFDSTVSKLKKTGRRMGFEEEISELGEKYNFDISGYETEEEKSRRELMKQLASLAVQSPRTSSSLSDP